MVKPVELILPLFALDLQSFQTYCPLILGLVDAKENKSIGSSKIGSVQNFA